MRRRPRGVVDERIDERWAAERADEARCGARLGACLEVEREAVLPRGGGLTAPLGAVVAALTAVAVAGAGRVVRGAWADREAWLDRGAWADREAWLDRGAWADREAWAARGVRAERSEDGRPVGARRESASGAGVGERSLRAAGVTAVGMLSSDLQLAGGAQVR
jgi:hypothetical protein